MHKATVLFVCVENSCRSQMAEGYAKTMFGKEIEVFSAGSRPSGWVDPLAVKAMQEDGIDISSQKSKGFADLPYRSYDYIATMGCGDVCPFFPAKTKLNWDIKASVSADLAEYRVTRDQIKKEVKALKELMATGQMDP